MPAAILVATPNAAFGELLRINLEDTGQYNVRVVMSGAEARALSGRAAFQVAILDAEIRDESFVPLCIDLLKANNHLRLVVIPPENNPNHPSLGGLMPHGYLMRPFYQPDLLDTVSQLLGEPARAPGGSFQLSATLPPWLIDTLALQNYLERELTATQAVAGLIGITSAQPGSGALRAAAGQLSSASAEELAGIVFRYWNRSEKSDLMRYVRLTGDKKDYLIYATQVTGDLVLVLVYGTSAPLSLIRPQTKSAAQSLATMPPEGFSMRNRGSNPDHQPAGEQAPAPAEPAGPASPESAGWMQEGKVGEDRSAAAAAELLAGWTSETRNDELPEQAAGRNAASVEVEVEEQPTPPVPETGTAGGQTIETEQDAGTAARAGDDLAGSPPELDAPDEQPGSPNSAAREPLTQPISDQGSLFPGFTASGFDDDDPFDLGFDDEEEPLGEEIINLSTLLGEIPPPNPGTESNTNGPAGEEVDASVQEEAESIFSAWQTAGENAVSAEDQHTGGAANDGEPAAQPQTGQRLVDDQRVLETLLPFAHGAQLPPERAIDPLEDTRPQLVHAISTIGQLEPVSPALSLLNYTCVLVPRLPQHYLTGDLADQLAVWVQQLCLAYGWRLEAIAIRPEYMQWTVQVAPAISPGNLVRIIRQRTSALIFGAYELLRQQNPSGDFWATGYLIVSGVQPPSAQLLRDFIAQTRKRQGITK